MEARERTEGSPAKAYILPLYYREPEATRCYSGRYLTLLP